MSGGADRAGITAQESARVRDQLASHRTLLAWVRTAMAFAGLGFAVARFGLRPGEERLSAYLGIALVVIAVFVMAIGFVQHRQLLTREAAPPGAPAPAGWPGIAVTACCLVACVALIPYLIAVAL